MSQSHKQKVNENTKEEIFNQSEYGLTSETLVTFPRLPHFLEISALHTVLVCI